MGDLIKGVSQDFEVAAVPLAEQVFVPIDKDIANCSVGVGKPRRDSQLDSERLIVAMA